jgi:Gpi18-like mannosyltransferase
MSEESPAASSNALSESGGARQGLSAYRSQVAALLIFLASRLLVLLGVMLSSRMFPRNPAGEFWEVNSSWYRYLLHYDSGWYLTIARDGYSFTGDNSVQQTVVFFPLYPLMIRAFRLIGIDYVAGALLIANVAGVVAISLLYELISKTYDRKIALGTIALLSFFPTSIFFSAGYTESLALVLVAAFFLSLKDRRFYLASVFIALGMATRPTCIVLLLPLLWELWRDHQSNLKKLTALSLACVAIGTSTLWLYMFYLWSAFRAPLAFITDQRAWWQRQTPLGVLDMIMLKPFAALAEIFNGVNPNSLDPWLFLLFVILIVAFWKRLQTSHALFAIGTLLFIYVTRGGTAGFMSASRYLLLMFPGFIVVAIITKSRIWLMLVIVAASSVILFVYSARFAQWYWIG